MCQKSETLLFWKILLMIKININLILELLKSIPVPCKGLYAFFKSLVILGVFSLRIRFSFDSTNDKLIEDDPS